MPQFDPRVRRLLFMLKVTSAEPPPRLERGTPDLRTCQAWLTNITPEGVGDRSQMPLSCYVSMSTANAARIPMAFVVRRCVRGPLCAAIFKL